MLPQNKISGLSIAWGRGKWAELDDGSFGYVFPEDDAYKLRITPGRMEELGVDEDDLYDCIAQIESEYGAPKDHRLSFGLMPNQGYSQLGITVNSRFNERVTCVFTPTSMEDGSYDGYFEWYFDQYAGGSFGSLDDYMVQFDKATDSRTANMVLSPVMPSYGEASEKTRVLEAGERENFLRQVWNYHKTPSRGFKNQLESELLPQWQKICEEYDDLSFKDEYKDKLLTLTLSDLKQVFIDLNDMNEQFKETRPEGPEAACQQKAVMDQLEMVKNELYKRIQAGEDIASR